ncbi:hypothetical protein Bbelb_261050 [Branchiostoma belcheri]|nr:hypothetical protein Bbelb_261050 [Branchiostoma belcheri]
MEKQWKRSKQRDQKSLEVAHGQDADAKTAGNNDRVKFGGAGNGPGKFQTTGGVAVSSTNEIFVTDEGNRRIQVFSMTGVFLRSFSTGNLKPHAISTGRSDTLWVALYAGVQDSCRSIAMDEKGNVFITHKPSMTVRKYDKNGVYLSSFDSKAGDLFTPWGISLDKSGRVIVGDVWNSKLEMFTAEGKHIRTVAYVRNPYLLATGGEGQIVVSDEGYFVSILHKY